MHVNIYKYKVNLITKIFSLLSLLTHVTWTNYWLTGVNETN